MLLRKVHSGSDKSLRGCDKKNNEKSNSRTIGNIFIVSKLFRNPSSVFTEKVPFLVHRYSALI